MLRANFPYWLLSTPSLVMFLVLFLSIFSVMNGKIDSLGNLKNDPNDHHPWFFRNELLKLNNLAQSWDYTCSFCFKTFPSAQALGGHQNAHKNQRREERRLCVKDHINYRKRAFIESRESLDVAVAVAPNGQKQAKLYHGDEGSSGTACMAVYGKKQGPYKSLAIINKPIFPVPVPNWKIKEEELDLTLKL